MGGGTSGRGLPGGSSRGGSVGWPGVAGGISGGSISIYRTRCLSLSRVTGIFFMRSRARSVLLAAIYRSIGFMAFSSEACPGT
jgi:hypothetical protein